MGEKQNKQMSFTTTSLTCIHLGVEKLVVGIPEKVYEQFKNSNEKDYEISLKRESPTTSLFIIHGEYFKVHDLATKIQQRIIDLMDQPSVDTVMDRVRPLIPEIEKLVNQKLDYTDPYDMLLDLIHAHNTVYRLIWSLESYRAGPDLYKDIIPDIYWSFIDKHLKGNDTETIGCDPTDEKIGEGLFILIKLFLELAKLPQFDHSTIPIFEYASEGYREDLPASEKKLRKIWQTALTFKGGIYDYGSFRDISKAERVAAVCIKSGCFNAVEIFKHEGSRDTYYDTSLNYAATPGIVKLLLDTGNSRPEVHGEHNDAVGDILSNHSSDEKWVELLKHPALGSLINKKTQEFKNHGEFAHPLVHAANRGYYNIVKLLIESYDIPVNIIKAALKSYQTDVWRKRKDDQGNPLPESEIEKYLKTKI